LDILENIPKKAAKILIKVIKSAVSNAVNNGKQKASSLYIDKIEVSK